MRERGASRLVLTLALYFVLDKKADNEEETRAPLLLAKTGRVSPQPSPPNKNIHNQKGEGKRRTIDVVSLLSTGKRHPNSHLDCMADLDAGGLAEEVQQLRCLSL